MTWSAEVLLAVAAVLCLLPGEPPPVEQLRNALAARWDVSPDLIRFDTARARLVALADAHGELSINGVLTDGRVLIADADGRHLWVRAGVELRVPVAARDLPRGHVLDSTDVGMATQVAWGDARPPRTSPLGLVTRRALRAGDALLPPAVAVPLAVRAGEDVRAYWTRGDIRIEVSARAAGTGAVGDTVAVRTAGGRRLDAVVSAPREVVLVGSGGMN